MLKLWKNIVTLGHIGYCPAPGTLGSFAAIPLVLFIYNLGFSNLGMIVLLIFFTLITLKLIDLVMPFFHFQDSSHIVIDEVLGMFYTFWNIKLNAVTLLGGFVLFRFFDITKILGISYLEKKISNPLAIVIDDILAGLFANIILRFLMFYEFL